MRFDLRQLQAFVTLANTANYREAASRLFITQPALTKQIQGLEQTLGCTLFKRGRHGAELTALGAQLLTQASALVEHGREFESHALAVASGVAGRLKIGFGLSSFRAGPCAGGPLQTAGPGRDGPSAGYALRHPAGAVALRPVAAWLYAQTSGAAVAGAQTADRPAGAGGADTDDRARPGRIRRPAGTDQSTPVADGGPPLPRSQPADRPVSSAPIG